MINFILFFYHNKKRKRKKNTYSYYSINFIISLKFIYLTESEGASRGGAEREGERKKESQAGSVSQHRA